ncbi:hypothetical protein FB45DRAFT_876413 [Roridomyces roridus]|uniref:Uncharacterized protein n=1 Tax=Roridomyces roridus TaxID=1738132 RepID=A0AAD7B4L1_9AGAR|nr:hypothetical protein FB45DRAFT_876413 [Roridomyces roridus]
MSLPVHSTCGFSLVSFCDITCGRIQIGTHKSASKIVILIAGQLIITTHILVNVLCRAYGNKQNNHYQPGIALRFSSTKIPNLYEGLARTRKILCDFDSWLIIIFDRMLKHLVFQLGSIRHGRDEEHEIVQFGHMHREMLRENNEANGKEIAMLPSHVFSACRGKWEGSGGDMFFAPSVSPLRWAWIYKAPLVVAQGGKVTFGTNHSFGLCPQSRVPRHPEGRYAIPRGGEAGETLSEDAVEAFCKVHVDGSAVERDILLNDHENGPNVSHFTGRLSRNQQIRANGKQMINKQFKWLPANSDQAKGLAAALPSKSTRADCIPWPALSGRFSSVCCWVKAKSRVNVECLSEEINMYNQKINTYNQRTPSTGHPRQGVGSLLIPLIDTAECQVTSGKGPAYNQRAPNSPPGLDSNQMVTIH